MIYSVPQLHDDTSWQRPGTRVTRSHVDSREISTLTPVFMMRLHRVCVDAQIRVMAYVRHRTVLIVEAGWTKLQRWCPPSWLPLTVFGGLVQQSLFCLLLLIFIFHSSIYSYSYLLDTHWCFGFIWGKRQSCQFTHQGYLWHTQHSLFIIVNTYYYFAFFLLLCFNLFISTEKVLCGL